MWCIESETFTAVNGVVCDHRTHRMTEIRLFEREAEARLVLHKLYLLRHCDYDVSYENDGAWGGAHVFDTANDRLRVVQVLKVIKIS